MDVHTFSSTIESSVSEDELELASIGGGGSGFVEGFWWRLETPSFGKRRFGVSDSFSSESEFVI